MLLSRSSAVLRRGIHRRAPLCPASATRCSPQLVRFASTAAGREEGESAPASSAAQMERAVECLRSSVPGWADVQMSQLEQTVVEGGLTNLLYKLTHSADSSKAVLVRIYGEGTDDFFSREAEIATFQALSTVGASPQCYGTFQGGRLEEFLDGFTLGREEIKQAGMIDRLATTVAQFHGSSPPVPGPRENQLMSTIAAWLVGAKQKLASDLSERDRAIIDASSFDFSDASLDREFAEMQTILATAESPLAFVHHDLIAGNFMNVNGKIRVIDFEYGWYDNTAMDIGNHWLEWTINYEYEGFPHYQINHDHFPTEAQQRRFVTSYLTAASDGGEEPTEEAVSELVREANMFTMASHYMWACWGFVQAGQSQIEFGHMEYGRERMEMYAECKRRFLATGRV
jgi:choline/ethanolamine kinase